MNYYTVTATGTYFVKAKNEMQAQDLVYEAMLGNDPTDILGWGEVHYGITVVEGTHSTSERPSFLIEQQ